MGRLRDMARGAADAVMDSPVPAARANAIAQTAARIAVDGGHPAAAVAVAGIAAVVTVAEQVYGRCERDANVTYATFRTDDQKGRRS
ncbi:hypothetical protein [Streptomyces sp. H39-S7]|uniref:hypothetical protein n=1 Tax=Streptomyces sp. H39-S7 TaxID=3004357 RepID=UPI0022AEE29D|nr:hypothetical protein [Streptomyces sp. H39-S7]MCZ4125962.1 hypothetical protein [Streptomyces sp. H39-S7]